MRHFNQARGAGVDDYFSQVRHGRAEAAEAGGCCYAAVNLRVAAQTTRQITEALRG
ncbi:hypothetical protein GCM10010195_12960 [Kitasatospora griseola]|nr:hypothetical protein GCM10010195_12960 [Kitasatospora griseola]